MKPVAIVHKRFADLLAQLGFTCVDKAALRYYREVDDVLQVFEVEKQRWCNTLYFGLHEDGARKRHIDLGEFEGIRRFDYQDAETLQVAIDNAYRLFLMYGTRWFGGEDVVTPHIAARRAESNAFRRERAVAEARDLFKAGRYAEAIGGFQAIEGRLDDVSAKMLEIAKTRASAAN